MNQNELIQQAFDAKFTEIGEAAWHDIGADKIFEYGWQACLAAQPVRVTDLTTKLRQLPRSENMANRHAEVMLNAAAEIERYYGGMLAWKQTAETRDRQLAEAMEKRVTERVEARLAQTQQEPATTRDEIFKIYCEDANAGDWHHSSQENYEAGYRKGLKDAKSQAPSEAYAEGQWWLKELDDLVKDGTPDQKRAVYGVVRKLMQEVNQAGLAQSDVNEQSQAQQPSEDLKEMEARKDAAYLERNQVVAALAKCFPSGIAKTSIEGWSEDWHGCVYIDLPTGQASWHYHDSQAYLFADLPAYTGKWDGHTTDEKYSRIAKLQSQAQQPTQELANMDHKRAAYFMRRFKHEEKMLGLHEQASLDYVLALLEQSQAQQPNAWQQAIDDELVNAHLGIAKDGITREEAKAELNKLIAWHIDVAKYFESQAQQTEPVAWGYAWQCKSVGDWRIEKLGEGCIPPKDTLALYVIPPAPEGDKS